MYAYAYLAAWGSMCAAAVTEKGQLLDFQQDPNSLEQFFPCLPHAVDLVAPFDCADFGITDL
jgi:hypothetical protein